LVVPRGSRCLLWFWWWGLRSFFFFFFFSTTSQPPWVHVVGLVGGGGGGGGLFGYTGLFGGFLVWFFFFPKMIDGAKPLVFLSVVCFFGWGGLGPLDKSGVGGFFVRVFAPPQQKKNPFLDGGLSRVLPPPFCGLGGCLNGVCVDCTPGVSVTRGCFFEPNQQNCFHFFGCKFCVLSPQKTQNTCCFFCPPVWEKRPTPPPPFRVFVGVWGWGDKVVFLSGVLPPTTPFAFFLVSFFTPLPRLTIFFSDDPLFCRWGPFFFSGVLLGNVFPPFSWGREPKKIFFSTHLTRYPLVFWTEKPCFSVCPSPRDGISVMNKNFFSLGGFAQVGFFGGVHTPPTNHPLWTPPWFFFWVGVGFPF